MSEPQLTVCPLGGLGEIGLNCMLLSTAESLVIIDCGLLFPDDALFGVDIAIPRFDHILSQKDRLKAIFLTHGHEDHIGALPWLLPYVDVPVYGSQFTLGLVENKVREHNLEGYVDLREVKAYDRVDLGDMAFNFFPVCHSIIDGFGLGIETPVGRVVHTGDFKIDRDPLDGQATDLKAFKEFSEQGVTLLFSDSTNVEQEGFALTEREIKGSMRSLFEDAEGRILVTLFSSHIQRMQEIFDLAEETGRKVGISGKSLARNIDLARDMGKLRVPSRNIIETDELPDYRDDEIVLLVTGSQGESLASLSRLSTGEHRQLNIKEGDLVLMSSRFIPGNTKAITKVINRLYKLGAEVLYEKAQGIHASGHAHKEELRTMLETVKPKYFIPVHGEYRHLIKHSRLAVETGVAPERALVIEDGEPVTFLLHGIRFEENIPVQCTLVDGKGVGDVGQTVLKERQLLAGEGLVIVAMVVDVNTGEILRGPEVTSKGFVFEQHYSHLLEDAKCIVLDVFENIPPGQTGKLKERIRSALRRFFRKVLGRDPVVIPLVISLTGNEQKDQDSKCDRCEL
ncbi:ribonuclease J [Maridesulfovibrio hydrothermalis]|uniref:Ribonuclease J n=1 Tax=Maridesulfovibrio hydrothermalis AM13 = DSM 14728 TaxID=1121451 RepID=L0REE4_9BACT|nr:ribonuclease J [Maridesulfovibrio hydrothermalis]CCO25173.1 Beta-lactamase domain protein [Maridesulfovibrio hydrothermalis AM13 = DSM 14728]